MKLGLSTDSEAKRCSLALVGSGQSQTQTHEESPLSDNAMQLDSLDQDLAAYWLARQILGRPVSSSSKRLLMRANESKKTVLRLMPYGRSNILTDLEATHYQGFYRLKAQRFLSGSASSLGQDSATVGLQDAVLTCSFGSGNCGEFANVAAHVHAAKLCPQERLETLYDSNRDHAWVKITGAQDGLEPPPVALLDVWSDGPALEPQDNCFAADITTEPEVLQTIDYAQGRATYQQFEQMVRFPNNTHTKRGQGLIAAYERDQKRPPQSNVYTQAMSCVSQEFAQAAQAALQNPQCELTLRTQAAQLAKEFKPNLLPAQEKAVVDGILHAGLELSASRARSLGGAQGKLGSDLPLSLPHTQTQLDAHWPRSEPTLLASNSECAQYLAVPSAVDEALIVNRSRLT